MTVEEFLITHDLIEEGEIYASVGYCAGGRGDELISAIITWIPVLYKIISVPSTVNDFLKFTRLLFQSFKGDNNDVASNFDVCEMLTSKDVWNEYELSTRLQYIDVSLLELLMNQNGFEKQGDNFYRTEIKEGSLGKDQTDYSVTNTNDLESSIWGVQSKYGKLEDLENDLYFVNKILTSIICQLDYLNSDLKEMALELVSIFIRMNHLTLKKGDCFRFIEINEKMTNYDIIDDETIERLYFL